MAAALIERDDEIDLVLTAQIVKGKQVLLVGPNDCVKSLLGIQRVHISRHTNRRVYMTRRTLARRGEGGLQDANQRQYCLSRDRQVDDRDPQET